MGVVLCLGRPCRNKGWWGSPAAPSRGPPRDRSASTPRAWPHVTRAGCDPAVGSPNPAGGSLRTRFWGGGVGSCRSAGSRAPAGAGASASAGPARPLKRPFVPSGDTKGSSPAEPGLGGGTAALGCRDTCPGSWGVLQGWPGVGCQAAEPVTTVSGSTRARGAHPPRGLLPPARTPPNAQPGA